MRFVNEETRLCYERVMRRDIGYAKLTAKFAQARDLDGLFSYLGFWQDQFFDDLPFDLSKVALDQLSLRISMALECTAVG
jgi:hypothetical protein